MKQLLIFPPGWSLNVGNPHLALPLLNSILKRNNIDVKVRDLNWEIAKHYGVNINLKDATNAVEFGTMEAMNEPYFRAEDKLMEIAKVYDGEWNLQLGFKFNKFSFYSSNDVYEALRIDSPFTEYFKEEVLPWVEHEIPETIAFSVSSIYQIIPSLHLSWLLRNAGYRGLIVFGGNTISRLKDEIVNTSWLFDLVNCFIVFQGEIPFLTLVNAIDSGKNFNEVPNLIWREKGEIKQNAFLRYQDPNLIPTPDFGGFSVGKYWGVNYLPLLATRGCYFAKCSFCAISYGYGEDGSYGIRETELVFQDIIALKNKYNINRFKFMDEAVSPKTLIDLSGLILNEMLDIEWEGYLRLERHWLDKSFVNKLAHSGFKKGYFGLEIYPNNTRANLKKHDYAKEILAILENCRNAGIKVNLFCMFGFPGTGRKEAEKTVEFILKYRDLIDTVDLNPYTYARHTNVLGIEKIVKDCQDWALEYDYYPTTKDILLSKEVEELTNEMEDIVWTECHRLLHPIYRLVSPWNYGQVIKEEKYALSSVL